VVCHLLERFVAGAVGMHEREVGPEQPIVVQALE
jgi:hypothetical protein